MALALSQSRGPPRAAKPYFGSTLPKAYFPTTVGFGSSTKQPAETTIEAFCNLDCVVGDEPQCLEGSDGGPAQHGLGLAMSAPHRSPISFNHKCQVRRSAAQHRQRAASRLVRVFEGLRPLGQPTYGSYEPDDKSAIPCQKCCIGESVSLVSDPRMPPKTDGRSSTDHTCDLRWRACGRACWRGITLYW